MNWLDKQIHKIVKERVKIKRKNEKSSDIYRLDCNVCGSSRVKLNGEDFETWDKELFRKQHRHNFLIKLFYKIRR